MTSHPEDFGHEDCDICEAAREEVVHARCRERIAKLEAALAQLRGMAAQFGDFDYGAVREASQDIIAVIDAVSRETRADSGPGPGERRAG